MTINMHGNDWCHICGKRKSELADIWYPKNAEHEKEETEYIRICYECVVLIRKVLQYQINYNKTKEDPGLDLALLS